MIVQAALELEVEKIERAASAAVERRAILKEALNKIDGEHNKALGILEKIPDTDRESLREAHEFVEKTAIERKNSDRAFLHVDDKSWNLSWLAEQVSLESPS